MTGEGADNARAGRFIGKAHHDPSLCCQAARVGLFVMAPRNGERGCRGRRKSYCRLLTKYRFKRIGLSRELTNLSVNKNMSVMARVPITVMGYHCERCGHEWIPRGKSNMEPKTCPKCKSPYWDRSRKMSYEDFSGRIKATLVRTARPMTWTEIRTAAALPQLYPNNQWVHRLERDIGLNRHRSNDGVILWQLKPEGEPLHAQTHSVTIPLGTPTSRKKSALE